MNYKNEFFPELYWTTKDNRLFNAFYAYDNDVAINPRDNQHCFCSFLNCSSKYRIGASQPEGMDCSDSIDSKVDSDGFDMDSFTKKCFAFKPLYIYDHSGLSLSTGRVSRWDSLFVGIAYVTRDNRELEAYLKDHTEEEAVKWAEGLIDGEIDLYGKFLSGEIYSLQCREYDFDREEWTDVKDSSYPDFIGSYYTYGSSYEKEKENARLDLIDNIGLSKEDVKNAFDKRDLDKVVSNLKVNRKNEFLDKANRECDLLLKELGCKIDDENKGKVRKAMKNLGVAI